jgi:hypothetical protein
MGTRLGRKLRRLGAGASRLGTPLSPGCLAAARLVSSPAPGGLAACGVVSASPAGLVDPRPRALLANFIHHDRLRLLAVVSHS